MKGQHHIKISNQKVQFSFAVQRNITIIRGDSATGKTTLVGMLSDYETLGKQSGVTVKCDKPCRVLTSNDWEIRLENIKDSIVFIDEGNKFIKSEDFARAVQNSNNYYVLITRENLPNLPYSIEEIYEIAYAGYQRNPRSTGELHRFVRIFQLGAIFHCPACR